MRGARRYAIFGIPGLCWLLPVADALAGEPASPPAMTVPSAPPTLGEAALQEGDLRIDASRVVLDDGVATGEGPVVACFQLRRPEGGLESVRVKARAFRYVAEGGVLDLYEGVLELSGGPMHFVHARLEPDRRQVLLEGTDWSVPESRWSGTAGTVEFRADGTWRAHDVLASPCDCPPNRAPWAVSARRMQLDPDTARATFFGGALRVGNVPVLPVPAGAIPLDKRHGGILPPELGFSPDGLEVGLPVRLVPGRDAQIVLEPILREERGFRLASAANLPLSGSGSLDVAGAGGWDAQEAAFRGMANAEGGWSRNGMRLASDATVVSDLDYVHDYQADYLSRQLSFEETRAVAGFGPLRLDHDGFQAPDAVTQRILGATVALPATGLGTVFAWANAGAALGGTGTDLLAVHDAQVGFEGEQGLGVQGHEGPLAVQGRGWLAENFRESQGLRDGATPVLTVAAVEGRATLPLWADQGRLRNLLDVALVAGGAVAVLDHGEGTRVDLPGALAIDADDTSLFWAGPSLGSLWIDRSGASLHVIVDAPLTSYGLEPSASAWLDLGSWKAQAMGRTAAFGQGSTFGNGSGESLLEDGTGSAGIAPLAYLSLERDDGTLDTEVAVIAASGDGVVTEQATAEVARAFHLSGHVVEPQVGLRLDLATGKALEEQVRVRFSHRRHCLDVALAASFAVDRTWPDLSLSVGTGGR
jgi:hypothetical protein